MAHTPTSGFPLYILPHWRPHHLLTPLGKTKLIRPQATCNSALQTFTPTIKSRPLMDRDSRLHDPPSPVPLLSTLYHRPRPLHFLVKHPHLMWLPMGANLMSSQKCLYSKADLASGPTTASSLPAPSNGEAAFPAQTHLWWVGHTGAESPYPTPHSESTNTRQIPERLQGDAKATMIAGPLSSEPRQSPSGLLASSHIFARSYQAIPQKPEDDRPHHACSTCTLAQVMPVLNRTESGSSGVACRSPSLTAL